MGKKGSEGGKGVRERAGGNRKGPTHWRGGKVGGGEGKEEWRQKGMNVERDEWSWCVTRGKGRKKGG